MESTGLSSVVISDFSSHDLLEFSKPPAADAFHFTLCSFCYSQIQVSVLSVFSGSSTPGLGCYHPCSHFSHIQIHYDIPFLKTLLCSWDQTQPLSLGLPTSQGRAVTQVGLACLPSLCCPFSHLVLCVLAINFCCCCCFF